jgi:hypothetical protein
VYEVEGDKVVVEFDYRYLVELRLDQVKC